ncbi:MAG: ABC transporter permease [Desulfobacteraceae bacterium]|nr:ABC transporter permease [Desulfobacteraceae bacterium]
MGTNLLSIQNNKQSPQEIIVAKRSLLSRILEVVKGIIRTKGGIFGLGFILLMIFTSIFAPIISPFDPIEQDIVNRFAGPSLNHLMGTDYLGRDILSRIIYGCRIATMVSFGSVTLSAILGVIMGVMAGYKEGSKFDYFIILIFDVVISFPQIILALAIVAVLGPSLFNLIVALAVTSFPFYGRIARAQTLSIKESDFVKAAEALGLKKQRIVFKHIIPNIMTPVYVCVGMDMATMIIYEAGLSFLGLGVQPPTASWGIMLRNGYKYIMTSPWMIFWPAFAIAVTMVAFALFSDSFRKTLDPKERKK